jgi:hypothetical protein
MKIKFLLVSLLIVPIVAIAFPKFASAANSSTVAGPGICTVTFFYAGSDGVYIGNSATLRPKTDYQLKATWKPDTCAAAGSMRIGSVYTKDGKEMMHYISCFSSSQYETLAGKKYVYTNMVGLDEGTKIRHFLFVGDSNSNCSVELQDRAYTRTTAFAEISTTFKEKTATNKPADPKTPDPNTDPGKDTGPIENPDTSVTITPGESFDTVLGVFYNPLEFDRPEELVVRIINALLLLVGILSVIMIIVGGLRMVASGGSEAQIKTGKQTIIWAVGGLIVSLMAFTIVAIIQSIIS